jgi:GNAT superfamily N-acetyltransferase
MTAYRRTETGVLQPCDIGHRVVVRRRTEGGLSDLLGELTMLDDERLVVRTETGVEHEIPIGDVVAGKPVPPRPARYSEIIALERIGARAWPVPEQEQLGDWLLRAAQGWTNRANSALPLGEAGIPLAEAVLACRDWYAARGLPPKITVPRPVRRDVAQHLDRAGWTPQPLVLVQTASLETMIDKEVAGGVEMRDRPSAEFLDLLRARRAGLPAAAEHVLTSVPEVRFAEVRADDEGLLAIARGAVVEDWLHLGLVDVVPAARRRGLARTASNALATWALGRGATRAFLQVEERNGPAVRLWSRLGFTTHHTYVTYRREP